MRLRSHLTFQTKISCTVDFAHAVLCQEVSWIANLPMVVPLRSRAEITGKVGLHAGPAIGREAPSPSGRS